MFSRWSKCPHPWIQNPFNGIERDLKGALEPTLERVLGIHSMELKGAFVTGVSVDRRDFEESIQWNWKLVKLSTRAGSRSLRESIQWNWKHLPSSNTSNTTRSASNPFNGIERSGRMGTMWCTSSRWIHSMELKGIAYPAPRYMLPVESMNPFNGIESFNIVYAYSVFGHESIQWNWKINWVGDFGLDLLAPGNPFNGIERQCYGFPGLGGLGPQRYAWIHSMELKVDIATYDLGASMDLGIHSMELKVSSDTFFNNS